jgi:hypothetical protein
MDQDKKYGIINIRLKNHVSEFIDSYKSVKKDFNRNGINRQYINQNFQPKSLNYNINYTKQCNRCCNKSY